MDAHSEMQGMGFEPWILAEIKSGQLAPKKVQGCPRKEGGSN
jgi:hypothetical protein